MKTCPLPFTVPTDVFINKNAEAKLLMNHNNVFAVHKCLFLFLLYNRDQYLKETFIKSENDSPGICMLNPDSQCNAVIQLNAC